MVDYPYSHNPAGITTLTGDPPNEFVVAGRDKAVIVPIILVSTAVDSSGSHTPTTRLREGLILGKVTSSGKYKQWDVTATDGSQIPLGILNGRINMKGPDDAVADQAAQMLVPVAGMVIDHAKLFPASNASALAAFQQSGAMFSTNVLTGYPFPIPGMLSAAVELDFGIAAATPTTLIDKGLNPNGLVIVNYWGVVTEVFAGTEDQGIADLTDDSDNSLSATLTAKDLSDDVVGDIIVGAGTNKSVMAAVTGDPGINLAAGKGLKVTQSQLTTGTNAGKMLCCVTAFTKPA